MSSLAIEAVYRTLALHLDSLCEGRVFPDVAPGGTASPFVVYGFLSGGDTIRRARENATITLVVKCIAARLEDAFAGAKLIRAALADNGTQGLNTMPIDADWVVTTVSQTQIVHMVEIWNGQPLYHSGYQYEFVMERRTD